MQGQLSQKERMLLEDLKKEENLCVVKYQSYAQQAQDSQLSQLFNKLAGEEQKHYDTVNQLLQSSGQSQPGQQGQGGGTGGQGGWKQGQAGWKQGQAGQKQGQAGQKQGQAGSQGSQTWNQMGAASLGMPSAQYGQSSGQMSQTSGKINLSQTGASNSNSSDKYLLQDMLSTEKYVSSAYDTSVFESAQPNVRQALQHIQQDEQNHGEQLYQYMSSHGMYQTQ